MLDRQKKQALHQFLQMLIDQEAAEVIVPAYAFKPGYWFGGGNLLPDENGIIWLSGRYRNAGDSRTGLAAGERGLECTIFRSDDAGESFKKVLEEIKDQYKVDFDYPVAQFVIVFGFFVILTIFHEFS